MMTRVEEAKWAIIEANFSRTLEEQKQDILSAVIADYIDRLRTDKMHLTGNSHVDGTGALWVEIRVEGQSEEPYWHTNQREDLIGGDWISMSYEKVEHIPDDFIG